MGAPSAERKVRIAIIGAGISGLGQAIRLKERLGDKADITIYERDGDAGGVWLTSRWPGAGVDVPIHWYQLYSDPVTDWKSVYASREDVWAYWQSLIDKHSLRALLEFNTSFLGSRWSEQTHAHTLSLQRAGGKPFEVEADFLISAAGPLSTPALPNIAELDTYEGVKFHCYRWDPAVELEGKRIGVVGNGSSGIQMVPGLSEIPGVQLTQFIRSGGYFGEKVNAEFTKLGKLSFRWLPGVAYFYRLWVAYNSKWARPASTGSPKDTAARKLAEDGYNAYLRKHAPAKYLEALTPNYPLGCKRVAMDAGWLASLHKPNVTLTHSPILSATATGLTTADGRHHPLDLLIFATGASVASLGLGLSRNVFDRRGRELAERWDAAGGPEAYRGVAVPALPNFFVTMGPNGTAGTWGFSSAVQGAAIARIVGEVVENGGSSVEVTEEAAEAFNVERQAVLQATPLGSDACTSWFKTKVGGKVVTTSGFTPLGFWWLVRRTEWNHWVVRRRRENGTAEVIDVGRRILLRRVARGLAWAAVAGLIWRVVRGGRADALLAELRRVGW